MNCELRNDIENANKISNVIKWTRKIFPVMLFKELKITKQNQNNTTEIIINELLDFNLHV